MSVFAAILGRIWPYLLVVAVLGGLAVKLDHDGYKRAQADQAALELRLTTKITDAVAAIDTKTAARISGIRSADRTIIQPTITREIANDPRYSNPNCALTPGMFDALNRARSLTSASSPDGGALPTAASPR